MFLSNPFEQFEIHTVQKMHFASFDFSLTNLTVVLLSTAFLILFFLFLLDISYSFLPISTDKVYIETLFPYVSENSGFLLFFPKPIFELLQKWLEFRQKIYNKYLIILLNIRFIGTLIIWFHSFLFSLRYWSVRFHDFIIK